mmetsp:Transcript_30961/g.79934  ORF Transcript_30961/g.79934 Transcript_30961/m.79934 type:complete len:99 (+) Transcript_30961:222-518(+)
MAPTNDDQPTMFEQAKSAVTGAATSAKDATNKMLGRDQEEDKMESAGDKIKGAAQDVGDAAGEKSSDTKTSAQETAAGAAEKAGDLANKAQDKVAPNK